MEPVSYLRALRHHWVAVVLSVLVAVGSALALVATVAPPQVDAPSYTATKSFLFEYGSESGGALAPPGAVTNLGTVAALVSVGAVPDRVLRIVVGGTDVPSEAREELSRLNDETLATSVAAEADPTSGLLQITAEAGSPEAAEFLAATAGQQLVSYLEELQSTSTTGERQRLEQRVAALRVSLPGATSDQAAEIRSQLKQALSDLRILEGRSPDSGLVPTGGTDVQLDPKGFDPTGSVEGRLVIAAIVGLIAGLGLALVLERGDSRIRTRAQAEESYHAPVLAEIPPIAKRSRGGIAVIDDPRSPAAEGFHLVGAEVSRRLSTRNRQPSGRGAAIVVVTSAGPDEGKSTLAANVSVALAESGRRVMLLSCDLRRPTVHRLFGVDNEEGLIEALEERGSPVLNGHVRDIGSGVSLVPSGMATERPGELLASERMTLVLREARSRCDIVVIDTSPILTVSDAAHLLSEADVVLLVARAGRTTSETAVRTKEVVARLGDGEIGVVLNDAKEGTRSRGYGGSYGAYLDKRRRGFPSLSRHSKER